MGVLHFRYKERRRTLRVALSVPVAVHGQDESGEKFCAHVVTHTVSRHGAGLLLDLPVIMGQTLHLVNENSNRKIESRVVAIRRERDGKSYVGVEFVSGDANFWHMTFPIPGARPLRRAFPDKVTA